MRTFSTTHASRNLDAVSRRNSFKTGPIKSVFRIGLVLFLAALLSPAAAWALPIEAVQRSVQQRWAVVNGGANTTFPNRSDGASPGLYPADGFYGADLNDPTRVNILLTDLEGKTFTNPFFTSLSDKYVLFTEIEGTQLAVYYQQGSDEWHFVPLNEHLVRSVSSIAPPNSSAEVRLQYIQQALLLCRQAGFDLRPPTALAKGAEAYTDGPNCDTWPPCGSSYDAAVQNWVAATWQTAPVILIPNLLGEMAFAILEGGQGGSCRHDRVNLYSKTGRLPVNIGDSPGYLDVYINVYPNAPLGGNNSLPSCPVPADSSWHVIDQLSGSGQLYSRWIPVDPALNDNPPQIPGCSNGGWFMKCAAGLFRGNFTDSWNTASPYTKDCDKKVGGDQCEGDCAGMARYSAHAMLASLNIKDTPLRYSPPRGPAVKFTLTYNQREAQSTIGTFSNVGANWTFSWLAYVTDDPNTQATSTSVYLPGGGSEVFLFNFGTQTYAPDPQSNAVLVHTAADTYERRLPDGSKQLFGPLPNTATSYPRILFMKQMVDPAGNALTINYDANNRISGVTDALGQTTTLSYQAPGDPFKITKVEDPFGRYAVLAYAGNNLASVTDPVSIVSQFGYATGTSAINSLTTPYGTSTFTTGTSGSTRWLEMTDPMGGKERVEYRDNAPGIGATAPANTVPSGFTNSGLDVANTFYWDKRYSPVAGVYDYTQARITHWAKNATEGVTGIVASEKAPLEYRVWTKYAGQSDTNHTGPTANPIQVARILADDSPQVFEYEYNGLGKTTKMTDPAGRVTIYSYHSNQIDLHEVRQTSGANNELLRTLSNYHSSHQPQTETDAAGQVTTYTYNAFGQILSRTNAKSETTSFAYGGSVPNGYLASITSPQFNGASAVVSFTYDLANRVYDVTYEPDYSQTRTFYDDLDRPTYILYPDETYEQFAYADINTGALRLEVTRSTDRTGRHTDRHYNANGQMDSITDPLGRMTQYGWCTCGSLTSITDPNGNLTTFNRDLQSRVYQKVFADTSTINYLYEGQTAPNTAGATSRLKWSTDALNRRTNYFYDVADNISSVSYTNTSGNPLSPPTPSVTYTYYSDYNRIWKMNDGNGLTEYVYYPITTSPGPGAGKLHTIAGPLSDDTISFGYDELGRVINQAIEGAEATEIAFDSLGRLTSTHNLLGDFGREYFGVTPRLKTLSYPQSQTANYVYYGNEAERRVQTLENLDKKATNLSKFDYTYYSGWNVIAGINRQLEDVNSERWFEYDDAQQLVISRNDSNPSSATEEKGYGYDSASNRTIDSVSNPQNPKELPLSNSYTLNNVNEIESISIQNGMLSWEAYLSYDLAGNMIDDGQGKTFEWDAANRLTAINIGSGRSEFTYDGLNRRTKIVEKTGSTVTSTKQFIWVGSTLAQERDENNTIKRTYFAEGELRGVPATRGAKSYYYSRDHLGSIREVTDAKGAVEARYDYDPYGLRTKVGGALDVDFGYTGHYHHAPSGFNLALYRAYYPALGRWLSRDPIGEEGGVNLYAYVGNSPISFLDPLGLFEVLVFDPRGQGSSSFGHTATVINGTSYSFGPRGMDVRSASEYLALNNQFRSGIGLNVPFSDDQALQDCLANYPTTGGSYNFLTNSCTDPLQRCLNKLGYRVNSVLGGAAITPAGLASAIITSFPDVTLRRYPVTPR